MTSIYQPKQQLEVIGKIHVFYKFLLALLFLLILLGIYSVFKSKTKIQDPFQHLIPVCSTCDLWSVLHVLTFAILAFFFPQYWLLLFALGVIWEFCEDGIGYLTESKVGWNQNAVEGHWWYGRYSDVWANSLGILIGVGLNKLFVKNHQ